MQRTTHRLVDASSGAALGRLSSLASNAPSTSSHGVSRRQDVHCCVLVAVVVGLALGAIPLANGQRQSFNDVPAGRAPLARRVEAINALQYLAVLVALVLEHPADRAQRGVGEAAGEAVVLDHATHVQVLDADHKNMVASCDWFVKVHPERRFLCQLKQAVSTPSIL